MLNKTVQPGYGRKVSCNASEHSRCDLAACIACPSKGSRLCAVDDWIVQVSRQFIFADVWLALQCFHDGSENRCFLPIKGIIGL